MHSNPQVSARYPEGIDVTASATKSLRRALKQEKKKLTRKASVGGKQGVVDARQGTSGLPKESSTVASRRGSAINNVTDRNPSGPKSGVGASTAQENMSRRSSVSSQKRDSVGKGSGGGNDRSRGYSILESMSKASAASNPNPLMNRRKSNVSTILPLIARTEEKRKVTEDISVDRSMEDRVRGIKGLLGLTPNQSIGDIVSKKFPNNIR